MASKYLIQVIEKKTGLAVQWAPGLGLERQFEDEVCKRVEAKGVGLLRTSAEVVGKVREALDELLHDLKADVPISS